MIQLPPWLPGQRLCIALFTAGLGYGAASCALTPTALLPSRSIDETPTGSNAGQPAFPLILEPLSTGHPGGGSGELQQPEAVLRRFFSDPPVAIRTPAFAQPDGFTDDSQMAGFLAALQSRSRKLHLLNLAYSQQGRPIPMLVFTAAGSGTARALRDSGKPTVWIHAQLHGNEPAAAEGALALADDLAGPMSYVLERINVVIIPRVNVDGAARFARDAADGRDLNRDAMRLNVSESLALRRASLAYMPAVTVDAHEYYATRASLARLPGGPWLESHDLLMLGPENPNVPQRLRAYTNEVFLAGAARAATIAGLRAHPYYTVQVREAEEAGAVARIDLVSGGLDARIGRNFHGLLNQVSILLETRGIGIGRQSFRRRVFSQLVAMRSIVNQAWRDPAALQAVIDAARGEVIARGAITGDRDPIIVAARRSIERHYPVPFIDASNATVRVFEANWQRYEPPVPTLVRERPFAYLIAAGSQSALLRLETFGVELGTLAQAQTLQVQSWRVNQVRRDDALYEGAMRQTANVELFSHSIVLPAGTRVALMSQALANLIAECLEPEAGDSFVRFGVLPAEPGHVLPVHRLMEPVALAVNPYGHSIERPE